MKRLEGAEALDEPAEKLVKVVGPATRPRVVKNALSGTWLGHRFHPLMVPLPIGFWTGALLFDLVATRRARWAADTLVGAGHAAARPPGRPGPRQLQHPGPALLLLVAGGPAAGRAQGRGRAGAGRGGGDQRRRLPRRPPVLSAGRRGREEAL